MDDASQHVFLAEWYRTEVTTRELEEVAAVVDTAAARARANGLQVQLLVTLAVPTDEVLFGVFSADSADTVVLTCQRAGVPVARLSPDVLLGAMSRADSAGRRKKPPKPLSWRPFASFRGPTPPRSCG